MHVKRMWTHLQNQCNMSIYIYIYIYTPPCLNIFRVVYSNPNKISLLTNICSMIQKDISFQKQTLGERRRLMQSCLHQVYNLAVWLATCIRPTIMCCVHVAFTLHMTIFTSYLTFVFMFVLHVCCIYSFLHVYFPLIQLHSRGCALQLWRPFWWEFALPLHWPLWSLHFRFLGLPREFGLPLPWLLWSLHVLGSGIDSTQAENVHLGSS